MITDRCIALVKKWEGLSLTPYRDAGGNWTIGYGHVVMGQRPDAITQKQADDLLMSDISNALKKVLTYNSKYAFTQCETDALTSFAYNIGSIKQLTKDGKRTKTEIASKILEYTKCNGKVLRGLVARRQEEHDLFVSSGILPDCNDNLPFLYRVNVPDLIIRTGPSTQHAPISSDSSKRYTGIGAFTITEVDGDYGRLKSGVGWISLNSKYGYRLK